MVSAVVKTQRIHSVGLTSDQQSGNSSKVSIFYRCIICSFAYLIDLKARLLHTQITDPQLMYYIYCAVRNRKLLSLNLITYQSHEIV
jgi:hypothetical protein